MRTSIAVSLFFALSFSDPSYGQQVPERFFGHETWEWNTESVADACLTFAAVTAKLDNDLCSTPMPLPVVDPTREPIILVVSIDNFNNHQVPPGTMQMALVFHSQQELTHLSNWRQPWHGEYQLSRHPWNSGRVISTGTVAGPYPVDRIADVHDWREMWSGSGLETWDASTLYDVGRYDTNAALDIFDSHGTKEVVKLMFTGDNRGGIVLQQGDTDILSGDFLILNYPQVQLPETLR